jgi:hypothetical protein
MGALRVVELKGTSKRLEDVPPQVMAERAKAAMAEMSS